MNNYEEQEIDLIGMLFHACKKWRACVVGAIIIAFLAGGFKLAYSYVSFNNPETFEKIKESYEIEKQAYDAEGVKIQADRKRVNEEIVLQREYLNGSYLMKLNPSDEWSGQVNMYIDTKYQIMPNSSVQNENPAYRIVNAYYDYYLSGGLYTEVMSQISLDIPDVRYLKEILSVGIDAGRYTLSIGATADTEVNCQELLTVATSVFQKKKADITKQVGEHTLAITQVSPYSQINVDRERFQTDQRNYLNDLEVQRSDLSLDYKEWLKKEKELKEPDLDMKDAIKSAVKWFIIAGVVGGGLMGMVFCAAYIFSGTLLYGVMIPGNLHEVGVLPDKSAKKVKGIDKLVRAIFGQKIKSDEYDSRVATAAIHMAQLAGKLEADSATVALVSDMETSKLTELVDEMNKNLEGKCKLVSAGNILVSKDASKGAENASAVVMVAEQDYTNKSEFTKMVEQLRAYDKCILGVLVTNVN